METLEEAFVLNNMENDLEFVDWSYGGRIIDTVLK